MNERFNGKIAIVTGAASGIGRAVAERFFKEGASVFAVDRYPETLAKLPPAAGALAATFLRCCGKRRISSSYRGLRGQVRRPRCACQYCGRRQFEVCSRHLGRGFRILDQRQPLEHVSTMPGRLAGVRKRRGNILNMASGLAIVGMAKQAAYTCRQGRDRGAYPPNGG